MAQDLRTVVAVTVDVIETNGGFVHPPKSTVAHTKGSTDTYTKVLKIFEKGIPNISENHYRLADEIIDFFKHLPEDAKLYADIQKRDDAPMYQSCIDISQQTELTPSSIVFAVYMANLWAKLRPKPLVETPNIAEAEMTPPNTHMGKRDVPGRFFAKLVAVGAYVKPNGGNSFEIRDRNNNKGIFYERAERLKGIIYLGDCFSMFGTPVTHHTSTGAEMAMPWENTIEKETIFRSVQIIENKGPSSKPIDPSFDKSGLFIRS